jgi:hypothetical protein
MQELFGDSSRNGDWAAVRLLVEGQRIVRADAPGLARELGEPVRQGRGGVNGSRGNVIQLRQELAGVGIRVGMGGREGQDLSLVKKSTKCYTWGWTHKNTAGGAGCGAC